MVPDSACHVRILCWILALCVFSSGFYLLFQLTSFLFPVYPRFPLPTGRVLGRDTWDLGECAGIGLLRVAWMGCCRWHHIDITDSVYLAKALEFSRMYFLDR